MVNVRQELELLMPPPAVPYEVSKGGGWIEVKKMIGSDFPLDYKWFLGAYGSGRIDGFIAIFNPFSSNKNLNLFCQIETRLGVLKELAAEGSEDVPFDLFPTPGGLLPCGVTDNGDVIYWMTDGRPDCWKVAVNAARSPEWEVFPGGVVEFIWKVLTRRELCHFFPDDFPSNEPVFISSLAVAEGGKH